MAEAQQHFEGAEVDYAALNRENREAVTALIGRYRDIIRAVGSVKDHPLKGAVVDRLNELRELERTLLAHQAEATPSAPADFVLHANLSNVDLIPPADREAFEKAVLDFKNLRELIADERRQAFDQFTVRIAERFNKRQEEVFKSRDQASTITALRGATFELTRLTTILRYNLEEVDFKNFPQIAVSYKGYPKATPDYSQPPIHEIKDAEIDFDVPLVREGKPYVYETKSYPRKRFGDTVQVRNQALKYQKAIEDGLVSGATIEVSGRLDLDFLGWAMGLRVDDPGAVPAVEIIYNLPLPSGKEYRFVLKRGLKREETSTGVIKRDLGLNFKNENHYDEKDQMIVAGLEQSLADKSIINILASTNVPAGESNSARDAFFESVTINTDEDFQAALERLLGYSRTQPESVDRVLRGFFGDGKKKPPVGQDRLYTDGFILGQFSALLGYSAQSDRLKALKDIWGLMFEDPSRITSTAVYQVYDRLRNDAIQSVFAGKKQTSLINSSNTKSAVSEYATAEYVERSLRTFLDYLAKNPEAAAVKRHYVISEDRIPDAVARTLTMLQKIADYERGRLSDAEGSQRHVARQAMGYLGHKEGVALDIEHVLTDVLYSMNKEGVERARVVDQLFKGNEGWKEFFEEGSDPQKVQPRFKTEAELDALLGSSPTARMAYESLGRKRQPELRKIAKEAAFVRDYDWTERFTEISSFVDSIQDQDRHYQEIHIFDPLDDSGKTLKQANTNNKEIARTEMAIVRENVSRAKKFMAETGREGHYKHPLTRLNEAIARLEDERDGKIKEVETSAKADVQRLGQEQKELQAQKSRLQQKAVLADAETVSEIEALDIRIRALADERARAFGRIQEISEEYQARLRALNVALESLYKKAIPKDQWETFAKRIVYRLDQNMMKVIYAATAEGGIIVQEEVLRGDVSGRAAHSELVRGRNVYGAGELAFERQNGRWVLTEINNGSGHYRPDASTTLFYIKSLLTGKGIDVSHAQLTDCILRGIKLRESSLF